MRRSADFRPSMACQGISLGPAERLIRILNAGRAYCFGGGLYIDPVFPDYDVKALVGPDPTTDAAAL